MTLSTKRTLPGNYKRGAYQQRGRSKALRLIYENRVQKGQCCRQMDKAWLDLETSDRAGTVNADSLLDAVLLWCPAGVIINTIIVIIIIILNINIIGRE